MNIGLSIEHSVENTMGAGVQRVPTAAAKQRLHLLHRPAQRVRQEITVIAYMERSTCYLSTFSQLTLFLMGCFLPLHLMAAG